MCCVLIYYAAAAAVLSTVGPSMFCHSISVDIRLEKPLEKAARICSWIYIKNVSDDQHRAFHIVLSRGTLLRCIAIAPPALSEWELTDVIGKPFFSKPIAFAAVLTEDVMVDAPSTFAIPFKVK
jgi:hypothetical protein